MVAASARSVPTRPSRDSSTDTTCGWYLSSAAAARALFGAMGSRVNKPVTAAPIATTSIAAAVIGTNIANGLPGSAKGAESGCRSRPLAARSAAIGIDLSRTSSKTAPLSAPSSSSTTSRPNDPSMWALATPGILRIGSSTTAAYSCQRGNGSNGSRSRCTRCPLCQRTGGVIALTRPVGRIAHPERPAGRVGHRLHRRARQLHYRAGQQLHCSRRSCRTGHACPHHLRDSTGHASDHAGYAGNLHSVTLQLLLPRLILLGCYGTVHMWRARSRAMTSATW